MNHDVTIYPIYSETSGTKEAFLGCLQSEKAFSVELPPGSFLECIKAGIKKGDLALSPGHYLLLEFQDDVEEYGGLVFTITKNGEVKRQCKAGTSVPNLTSWPPKQGV